MGTAQGFLVLLVVATSCYEILALEAELEQIEPNELLNTDWINSLDSKILDDSEIESLSVDDSHAGKDIDRELDEIAKASVKREFDEERLTNHNDNAQKMDEGLPRDIGIDRCKPNPCENDGACINSPVDHRCICKPGFTGANCEKENPPKIKDPLEDEGKKDLPRDEENAQMMDQGLPRDNGIDRCKPNPCKNSGACINSPVNHKCICKHGFTGKNCEKEHTPKIEDHPKDEAVNLCDTVYCQHGGSCISSIGSYRCQCLAGFTGQHCETAFSYCTVDACKNGGKCTTTNSGFTCSCAAGYTGVTCETTVNLCDTVYCQHGGSCISSIGSYRCQCLDGFTGQHCETAFSYCTVGACKNGGKCTTTNSGFTCSCAAGYTGVTCETKINYCMSDTCQNGGNCTSKIGSYKCSCTADYTGVNCESRIDRCYPNPCKNGGACVNSPGTHTCICKQGFNATSNCETAINYCKLDTCQNGGNCTSKIGSYKCSCTADYTGVNCESRIDRCHPNPCKNGGACVNSPGSHTCICKQGFNATTNCETAINYCKSDTCQNGGNCTSKIGSYKCSCTADYTGVNCESRIDRCHPNPCKNGGACVNSPGAHTCICKQGFNGTNCETAVNICDSVVCQNGGSCIKTLDSYRCQCAVGYTGQHCDTTVNYCRSYTCMNNGSCTSTTTGYVCTCAAGFTGKRCETSLNPCTPTTCKNNGSCIPSSNSYECFCTAGYSGRHCETVLNPCTSNTCKNNGSCIAGLGSYKCRCTFGFTGKHCETAVNPCTSNTCKNNGSCIVGLGSYKCRCTFGYTGRHCETAVNTSKFVDLVSCDFEGGFCSWKQHKGDKMDWTRRTGKTPSWYTGPSYDHTTKTYGHYIYTEVSRKGTGHNAILHSPEMTSDGKKRCLDFFYHMYGNGMGSFKVQIEVDGTMTELFKKSGNQANNWIQGLVNIDVASGSKFRIFFEGMRASSYKGDMAIDDIRLWAGACPTAPDTTPSVLPCFFERGFCKWKPATDDKGFWDDGKNIYMKRDESEQSDSDSNEVNAGVQADPWKKRKGKKTMEGRGPRGALTGWQDDYATYTGIDRDESTGTLTSPRISSFQPLCMHFFAHMYGSKIGQLAVKENNSNSEFIKFTGNQGRHWFEVKANIPEGKNMLVQIEVKQNERAVIAIDDIRVTPGKCAPKRELWKCDFSNGTCGFQNFYDACTWKLVNSIKPGGKSLQWNINNCPRRRSGEGLLIKAMKLPQRGGCLTMHYHVGQRDVCNFYVRLFEAGVGDHNRKRSHDNRLIYFKKAYGKGGVNQKAYVTIPPARENSHPYDVEFEVRLRNYGRYRCKEVTIDKLVLTNEICGNH